MKHQPAATPTAEAQPAGLEALSSLAVTVLNAQTEVSSREGAALSTLVEALRRPHINTVVIPSAGHFSRFGGTYQAMRTLIETETGTHVLVMTDRAEGAR